MPTLEDFEIDKLMNSAETKSHGGWGLFIFGILLLNYLFYGAFISDGAFIDEPLLVVYASIVVLGFGITLIALGSREKMNIFEMIAIDEEINIENPDNIDKESKEIEISNDKPKEKLEIENEKLDEKTNENKEEQKIKDNEDSQIQNIKSKTPSKGVLIKADTENEEKK